MKKIVLLVILALVWIITPSETQAQKKGDPMLQVPLGFASYTFRNQWKNGVPEALDIIQKMGFTEFEGGAPKGVSVEDFKKMLADRGISLPSTGTGFLTSEVSFQKKMPIAPSKPSTKAGKF